MSKKSPQRIPDWLHLLLSLVLSLLALLLVYAILFVLSDLVSKHLFALDLTDPWIGIISISLSFLITFFWIRRHRARTEPRIWKRNLRWSANLIFIVFLAFAGYIGYKIYLQDFNWPVLENYLPGKAAPADSSYRDTLTIDSLGSPHIMDSAHSSIDSLGEN